MVTTHTNKPKWGIKLLKPHYRNFWFLLTLPPYHNGRGWYVSIGLGLFAIYRGY